MTLKRKVRAKHVFPEPYRLAQNAGYVAERPQESGRRSLPGLTGKVGRHVVYEAKGNSGTAAGSPWLWSVSERSKVRRLCGHRIPGARPDVWSA